jgi:hypothetical protein
VKRLGRSPFDGAARLSIEASVERDGQGLKAVILTRTEPAAEPSKREIRSTAENCRALEAAIALAVALVIDPDAPLTEIETGVAPAATPSAPSPAEVPPAHDRASAPPVAERESAREVTASLALRASLATGLLPTMAPGAEVVMSASPSQWILPNVSALLVAEQKTSDGQFAFGLTALGLGVCVQPSRRQFFWMRACASALAGSLHSVVFELQPTRPGQRFWAGGALSPALRLAAFGDAFVELGGELIVPLTRESFTVGGRRDPVFRQQLLAFRGFLGAGLDFP